MTFTLRETTYCKARGIIREMRTMPGEYKLSFRDNSREIARTQVHLGDITAVSLPGALTAVGNLRAAIGDITLGYFAAESLLVDETTLSGDAPTDPTAQRGIKWTVGYIDTMQWLPAPAPANTIPNPGYQKIFTIQIPTADISLLISGQEDLDLTAGVGLAFKTAFDATARSPYRGSVSVVYVRYVD
jgi:hypothetical protein